jgi:hypothetical protein
VGGGARTVRAIFNELQREIRLVCFGEWAYPFAKDDPQECERYDDQRREIYELISFHINPSIRGRRGEWRFDLGLEPDLSRVRYTPKDATAFADMLFLFASGYLHRVRQCNRCRTWFSATVPQQTHCSDSCRVASFRESPAGREKRKLYMQRYRAQPHNAGGKRKKHANKKEHRK